MDVKEAVQTAKKYVVDVLSDEGIQSSRRAAGHGWECNCGFTHPHVATEEVTE